MHALAVLADDTRRGIVRLLADDGELAAGDIAGRFAISQPAVSRHLRVLREAGLVHERRDGRLRLYRANPDALAELRDWIDAYWAGRLDALKRLAEEDG